MAHLLSKNVALLYRSRLETCKITTTTTNSASPFISHLTTPPRRFIVNMSDSNSNTNPIKTVRVEVKGVVQGVFFRNWTVENASQLGVNGWVRNRRDGSVEALFSGESDKVDEMQQRCRRGPQHAVVTSFQAFPSSDQTGPGFQRRPTV
ncbi:Acylphosphatase [Heracleum sosnowskyi]|uniref:Acylphosphatase n=1 Tax=Heracleum sosnowskyi TaxID=360622 RepID=A0AAD8MZN9_9APIA|nr:Acylphosphatase [Heracleum sosnowskyi]